MINSSERFHCGSDWLLWGRNPSIAQGCHLLVDLSCSSDMFFVDRGKKKAESRLLLFFISIISSFK